MKPLNLRNIIVKTLALFSVVRGYNIAMLIFAQYMASLFVFNHGKNHFQILFDKNLHFIVLASALSAAAGYIINNFYDLERDAVERPLRNYIERFVSQNFKLTTYIILNVLALIAAALVSVKVAFFFLIYQFLVWFYSHKINKIVWLNNFYSVMLMVLPFFALFLYYENYSTVIFIYATFLIFLLLITDILKDLSTITADAVFSYETLPIVYGEKKTKIFVSILLLILSGLAVSLWSSSVTGYMRYFFLFTFFIQLLILIPLWISNSKTTYKLLYFIFKLLIGFGILNLVFIDLNPLDLQNLI